MRKICLLLSVLLALGLFAGCGEGEESAPPSSQEPSSEMSAPVSSNKESDPQDLSSAEALDGQAVPAIAGADYVNVTLGLEQRGWPKVTMQWSDETNSYSCSATYTDPESGVTMDYMLAVNKDLEIISGTFGIENTAVADADIFIPMANSFLKYCSTLPYDTSDAKKASQWVEENIQSALSGDDAPTLTIGDAVFTLSGNDTESGVPLTRFMQVSKNEEDAGANAEAVKEFPIAKEVISDSFDAALEKQGYKKLYDWELEETEKDGIQAYEYRLKKGLSVVFYESGNQKLTQLFFMADTNALEVKDMEAFGLLVGMGLAGMEPDLKADLDKELQMDNITEDASNFAVGDNCQLLYMVDNGEVMFNIMPK